MKTSYQQYNSFLKSAAKEHRCTETNFIEFAYKDLKAQGQDPNDSIEFKLLAMEHSLVEPDKAKKPIHFFIQDEAFLDWLVDCVPKIEGGSPEALIEMTGDRPAIIHFPTSSKYATMLFYMRPKWNEPFGDVARNTVTSIILNFSKGNRQNYNGLCMAFVSQHADRIDKARLNHVRLVAGIGMYLSCFPEMLKDGPPDDVKHPSHHKYGTIKTIGISPKVRDDAERGEITPHFRRGHFRVLRSDKFVHKQWQVVFVKQCFVKGEAATILSPEEAHV